MLRNLGVTFFLVALAGPASATDQSAMEETNCLMACDANQQNCQATRQVSTERNYSFAQHSPPSKMKSAVVRSGQVSGFGNEVGLTHAQIASRRLARATVGHEIEADLGTFRERRKASTLDR